MVYIVGYITFNIGNFLLVYYLFITFWQIAISLIDKEIQENRL